MLDYIRNILPRIQQHSQTLDKKEILVDQPWVLIDDNGNKQQYIFERDGKLIMSLNGQVQYGKWKYISAAKSLLIDRANDSLLFNHDFFTEGVCILKKDGFIDEPWMLVNQRVVPDLDIKRYLRSLLPENKSLRPLPVKGALLRYSNNYAVNITVGTLVVDGDDNKVSGTYQSSEDQYFYEIEQGCIKRIFAKEVLKTDQGEVIVEVRRDESASKGDPAYLMGGKPANGVYKTVGDKSYIKTLTAKNGRVTAIRGKIDPVSWALILTFVILVAAIVIVATK